MNIIQKTFKDHISKWIACLLKVQKDWYAFMQTLEGHSNKIHAEAFLPDSQLVACASGDTTFQLWDASTGSCRSMLKGHSKCVIAVAFLMNSQLVESASYDNTLRL